MKRWIAILLMVVCGIMVYAQPPAGTGNRVPDDKKIILGTDNDFNFAYDSVDLRLELRDSAGNVLAYWSDAGTTGDMTITGALSLGTPLTDANVSDTITVGASGSVNDAAIPAGISRDTEAVAAGDVSGSLSAGYTVAANAVALTTDTSGNYVASVATGTGLTGGAAGSEGAALTLSLSHLGIQSLTDPNADNLMFWDDSDGAVNWLNIPSRFWYASASDILNPTFQAASGDVSYLTTEGGWCVNGLIFEGTTADGIETRFQVTDPTGTDKTITVPDMSGTMKLRTIYWLPGPNAWTLTDPGADSIGAITADGTPYIPFDKDDEVVWFGPIPSDFDGSVETIQLTWMIPTATEAVTWSVSCTVLGNSDPDNTAEATPVSFTSATPDAADDHDLITVSSSAILGAATNAGKNVRVIVKATAAGAFTNEPRLIGLTMEY